MSHLLLPFLGWCPCEILTYHTRKALSFPTVTLQVLETLTEYPFQGAQVHPLQSPGESTPPGVMFCIVSLLASVGGPVTRWSTSLVPQKWCCVGSKKTCSLHLWSLKKIYLFLCLAVLGLIESLFSSCTWALLGEFSYCSMAACGTCAQQFWLPGLGWIVVHCQAEAFREIFPDQGATWKSLHWQVDSFPLS